jgi:hypothetical protein
MSLDTLAATQLSAQQQHSTTPPTDDDMEMDMEVDSWGFFADAPVDNRNMSGMSW